MNYLSLIQNMFSDEMAMIEVANACDKAYAVGTGNPDWYAPFGVEKPEKMAQNLAALVALNTGISMITQFHYLCPDLESANGFVPRLLASICEDKCDDLMKGILLRLANCSWNAGQPFRNITDKPLSRIKGMNMFDLLPPEEVDKDWHQIKAAAIFLKEKLGC